MMSIRLILLTLVSFFSILTLVFDQLIYQVENQITLNKKIVDDNLTKLKWADNQSTQLIDKISSVNQVILASNYKISNSYFIKDEMFRNLNSTTWEIDEYRKAVRSLVNDLSIYMDKENKEHQRLISSIISGTNSNKFILEDETFSWDITDTLNDISNAKLLIESYFLQSLYYRVVASVISNVIIVNSEYTKWRQIFILLSFISTMLSIIFLLFYIKNLIDINKSLDPKLGVKN